eukprot:2022469-Prymnesium_polylepis.1
MACTLPKMACTLPNMACTLPNMAGQGALPHVLTALTSGPPTPGLVRVLVRGAGCGRARAPAGEQGRVRRGVSLCARGGERGVGLGAGAQGDVAAGKVAGRMGAAISRLGSLPARDGARPARRPTGSCFCVCRAPAPSGWLDGVARMGATGQDLARSRQADDSSGRGRGWGGAGGRA